MDTRAARRLLHWGAVAGVGAMGAFGLELLADHFPNSGLARFVAYVHRGGPKA